MTVEPPKSQTYKITNAVTQMTLAAESHEIAVAAVFLVGQGVWGVECFGPENFASPSFVGPNANGQHKWFIGAFGRSFHGVCRDHKRSVACSIASIIAGDPQDRNVICNTMKFVGDKHIRAYLAGVDMILSKGNFNVVGDARDTGFMMLSELPSKKAEKRSKK